MSSQIIQTEKTRIQKKPNVCGGDACIANTRIPVWSIIESLRLGATPASLLTKFVTPLTAEDVQAALAYYEKNPEEIDNDIRLNEEA